MQEPTTGGAYDAMPTTKHEKERPTTDFYTFFPSVLTWLDNLEKKVSRQGTLLQRVLQLTEKAAHFWLGSTDTSPAFDQAIPTPLTEQSFTYVQYDRRQEKLTYLWDSLKSKRFIARTTPLSVFRQLFTGGPVTTKVVWTGNISELAYFVKLLHNDRKYIKSLKQKQWEVTCQCFIQPDGQPFDRTRFRTLKRPQTTAHQLERIVDHLK